MTVCLVCPRCLSRWKMLPVGDGDREAICPICATKATTAEPAAVPCPDADVCQTCPCAGEDDVCFPDERLRAEQAA